MAISSHQRFSEALIAAGASTECPSCHQEAWTVIPAAHLEVMGQALKIGLVTGLCRQCGFIRMHGEHQLNEALAGNRLDVAGLKSELAAATVR